MLRNLTHICMRVPGMRYFNSSKVVRYKQRNTSKYNPGVNRQLKVISEDEPDIDKANITYESIDELEEDFMESVALHDEVSREMKQVSKAQQYKIIERKYFKPPKEPGMLTWSEKEQIRFLHTTDPEQWNPETLSDSFPATPAIIKKLLKVKWKPDCAEKLKAHDQRVSDNWIAFYKGKLEIHDSNLKTHLSKFTDRKNGITIISDEEAAKITEVIMPRPKRTEFLSLITSFKKQENETSRPNKDTVYNTQQLEDRSHSTQQIDTLTPVENNQSKVEYTLEHLRKRLQQDADTVVEPADDVKAILMNRNENLTIAATSNQGYVAPSERFKTDAIVYRKSKKSPLTTVDKTNLPNRVQIPKDQWQPGKVYRVNDCFYNDRGYFLYRVPGLKT